jgi:hypothetical protein
VISSGPNSGNANQLVFSDFELYGTLKKKPIKPQAIHTPYFAVVEILGSPATLKNYEQLLESKYKQKYNVGQC